MEQATDKAREMILYVCLASETDPAFGATKLNKILFFADRQAYLQWGHSISGVEYQKLPNGPAPREMVCLMESMQEAKELLLVEREYFGHRQKKPIALREPCLTLFFNAEEIALIDEVVREMWTMNATQISNLSHDCLGWKLAREGETIPYASALLESRDLTEAEIEQAFALDLTGLEEAFA